MPCMDAAHPEQNVERKQMCIFATVSSSHLLLQTDFKEHPTQA